MGNTIGSTITLLAVEAAQIAMILILLILILVQLKNAFNDKRLRKSLVLILALGPKDCSAWINVEVDHKMLVYGNKGHFEMGGAPLCTDGNTDRRHIGVLSTAVENNHNNPNSLCMDITVSCHELHAAIPLCLLTQHCQVGNISLSHRGEYTMTHVHLDCDHSDDMFTSGVIGFSPGNCQFLMQKRGKRPLFCEDEGKKAQSLSKALFKSKDKYNFGTLSDHLNHEYTKEKSCIEVDTHASGKPGSCNLWQDMLVNLQQVKLLQQIKLAVIANENQYITGTTPMMSCYDKPIATDISVASSMADERAESKSLSRGELIDMVEKSFYKDWPPMDAFCCINSNGGNGNSQTLTSDELVEMLNRYDVTNGPGAFNSTCMFVASDPRLCRKTLGFRLGLEEPVFCVDVEDPIIYSIFKMCGFQPSVTTVPKFDMMTNTFNLDDYPMRPIANRAVNRKKKIPVRSRSKRSFSEWVHNLFFPSHVALESKIDVDALQRSLDGLKKSLKVQGEAHLKLSGRVDLLADLLLNLEKQLCFNGTDFTTGHLNLTVTSLFTVNTGSLDICKPEIQKVLEMFQNCTRDEYIDIINSSPDVKLKLREISEDSAAKQLKTSPLNLACMALVCANLIIFIIRTLIKCKRRKHRHALVVDPSNPTIVNEVCPGNHVIRKDKGKATTYGSCRCGQFSGPTKIRDCENNEGGKVVPRMLDTKKAEKERKENKEKAKRAKAAKKDKTKIKDAPVPAPRKSKGVEHGVMIPGEGLLSYWKRKMEQESSDSEVDGLEIKFSEEAEVQLDCANTLNSNNSNNKNIVENEFSEGDLEDVGDEDQFSTVEYIFVSYSEEPEVLLESPPPDLRIVHEEPPVEEPPIEQEGQLSTDIEKDLGATGTNTVYEEMEVKGKSKDMIYPKDESHLYSDLDDPDSCDYEDMFATKLNLVETSSSESDMPWSPEKERNDRRDGRHFRNSEHYEWLPVTAINKCDMSLSSQQYVKLHEDRNSSKSKARRALVWTSENVHSKDPEVSRDFLDLQNMLERETQISRERAKHAKMRMFWASSIDKKRDREYKEKLENIKRERERVSGKIRRHFEEEMNKMKKRELEERQSAQKTRDGMCQTDTDSWLTFKSSEEYITLKTVLKELDADTDSDDDWEYDDMQLHRARGNGEEEKKED